MEIELTQRQKFAAAMNIMEAGEYNTEKAYIIF